MINPVTGDACGKGNRMARYDFRTQRLFVTGGLGAGAQVNLANDQVHYLRNVLRLGPGARLLLFNGRDGEWLAEIADIGRHDCELSLIEKTRDQTPACDLHYLFAPLKRARMDFVVQKATEMGASLLQPVMTGRTVAERVKPERMRANAIEAAEQCGILSVREIGAPVGLEALIAAWDPARALIWCDEDAQGQGPLRSLAGVRRGPLGVLVGPEGGFSPQERELLSRLPFTLAISLGPRILRADTAAIAALALVQAALGDLA